MPAPLSPIAFAESQRRVLIGLVFVVLTVFVFRLFRDSTHIGDPPPARGRLASHLHDRIDPNTADVPTLAALPGLGEKRALDIIAYRDKFRRQHPASQPFRRPEDLLRIDGIGPAMMMQLTPYMVFPANPTTTPTTGPH